VASVEYEIKSVTKVFKVLEALSEEEITPADLAVKLDMNKSTLHRFLATLMSLGYIEKNENNTIRLTQSFINLGVHAQKHDALHTIARPYLEQLAQDVGESVLLAVFDGQAVQYVDNIESTHTVRTVFDPGKQAPAHAVASGKLFLSALDEQDLEVYLQSQPLTRMTENTITDQQKLLAELKSIKEQGYALDHEEYEVGLRGFACPIKNDTGSVIAALCIAGIAPRITNKQRIASTVQKLSKAADKISLQLGYQQNNVGGDIQ